MPRNPNEPTRKPHRLPAAVYARSEYVYFFTLCARHQGTPFAIPGLAEKVVESLLWTRDRYRWLVYAYCLMPDHLHFLCRPAFPPGMVVNAGARGQLPEGVLDHVGRFKSYTTTAAWGFGLVGPLWQRSSYDVVMDDGRPAEEVARYTLENPVRKGLVVEWTDWPYSGMPDPW